MATIRPISDADLDAVQRMHDAAFGSDAEGRLVRSAHAGGRAVVSLVAELDGAVVGHILFTPVALVDPAPPRALAGLGLAPMAVLPAHQRVGLGSALIRSGLERCRALHVDFVVVLGHPSYYPRFGFRRASDLGIGNRYGADDAFMILELRPGALPGAAVVEYGPDFAIFDQDERE